MTPAEHDVVGFDVAMDDAARVCIRQRIDQLSEEPHGIADGKFAVVRQLLPERLSLDEGHDVVEQSPCIT
jgi:hypothetical protein